MTAKRLMKTTGILFVGLLLLAAAPAGAQKVALKTNLLYDALLTPDLGIEAKVAPRWTVELSGNLNLWTVNDKRWKQWSLQPEVRYWFCHSFQGHFIGIHAIGGEFNFGNFDFPVKFLGSDFHKLKNERYEGWGAGAGIAYGYDWIINRHWNIEAEFGFGWIHARYDAYPCAVCGTKLGSGHHNYFGPTKVAINLEYLF